MSCVSVKAALCGKSRRNDSAGPGSTSREYRRAVDEFDDHIMGAIAFVATSRKNDDIQRCGCAFLESSRTREIRARLS